MSALPLFFAGPLLAAAVALLVRSPLVGRVLAVGVPAAVAVAGAALVVRTSDGSVLVAQVAGWPGGVAIPFVADLLAALMLTVSGILVVASVVFALATDHGQDRLFPPLVLMMTAGVYGAYLTADLFNLFVMVEVALLPSYILLARAGTPGALSAARLYLTVNLTASTLFLAGLGGVYAAAGTVNLAALSGTAAHPTVAVAVAVVLVALTVKAALVPTHSWLPATYPHATPAVTALFSGLLTKVGLYALIRIVTVVYEPGPVVTAVVVTVAVLSMVVGVLGALGEHSMRGVLSFHMVSQVGYVLVGVALAGAVGLTASVFYLVTYTLVKASLFLTTGAVEAQRGTGRIAGLGGVAEEHRWLGLAFLLAALSLTGIPPFSGFWAKLGVLGAALEEGNALVFSAALAVSLGTLTSMLKLGTGVFWGERPAAEVGVADRAEVGGAAAGDAAGHRATLRASLVAPGLALALLSLVIGLQPGPLLDLAATAGAGLGDPSTYVAEVLGR